MGAVMETVSLLKKSREQLWLNPLAKPSEKALAGIRFTIADIEDAEKRLLRFSPLIIALFPETCESSGIIESPLTEIAGLKSTPGIEGRLFIKRDSDLPIAGSVKARGGIYEVLKHTEDVLWECGKGELLDFENVKDRDGRITEIKEALKGRRMQVGSTGNLGMSIGIMSAALGYETTVHMSADAKAWKKALLREKGVRVMEYEGDYSLAVANGRRLSDADKMSYFVDDENSETLFLGYATAALRLKKQLDEMGICVDREHPINLYLPCGVGGAPGGICFGVKTVFGDAARCFFAEPVQAPCMLAALATGNIVSVTELGLTGLTQADGLAVGTASKLVADAMNELLDGEYTVDDSRLPYYQNLLYNREEIFIEPSSAASLGFMKYIGNGIPDSKSTTHIAWATGGRLVPNEERDKQLYMPEIVEVAAALISREGKFMVCRRPQNKARGGLWEFVGGKLEEGESAAEALIRECREELDIEISVGDVFTDVIHRYSDITIHLTVMRARIAEGEPKLLEHTQIAWITPDEMEAYDFCPADTEVLMHIKNEFSFIRGEEK
ncbi:MAG: D-serine ammonia-lyase [Clostridia bacterium]|nr:D-serine ammonia-lyase [Clostridia bacterium]